MIHGLIRPKNDRPPSVRNLLPNWAFAWVARCRAKSSQCLALRPEARASAPATPAARGRYAARLSGPLRDRVSLRAVMTPPQPGHAGEPAEATAVIGLAGLGDAGYRIAAPSCGHAEWPRPNAPGPQGPGPERPRRE